VLPFFAQWPLIGAQFILRGKNTNLLPKRVGRPVHALLYMQWIIHMSSVIMLDTNEYLLSQFGYEATNVGVLQVIIAVFLYLLCKE